MNLKGITTLRVNFDDAESRWLAGSACKHQSTLIVFRDGKEVARVTGETDRGRIAELLRKAL